MNTEFPTMVTDTWNEDRTSIYDRNIFKYIQSINSRYNLSHTDVRITKNSNGEVRCHSPSKRGVSTPHRKILTRCSDVVDDIILGKTLLNQKVDILENEVSLRRNSKMNSRTESKRNETLSVSRKSPHVSSFSPSARDCHSNADLRAIMCDHNYALRGDFPRTPRRLSSLKAVTLLQSQFKRQKAPEICNSSDYSRHVIDRRCNENKTMKRNSRSRSREILPAKRHFNSIDVTNINEMLLPSVVLRDVMKTELCKQIMKDAKVSLLKLSPLVRETIDYSCNPCIIASLDDISYLSSESSNDCDVEDDSDYDIDNDVYCSGDENEQSNSNSDSEVIVEFKKSDLSREYLGGLETFLSESLDLRGSEFVEDVITVVGFKPGWKSIETISALLCRSQM